MKSGLYSILIFSLVGLVVQSCEKVKKEDPPSEITWQLSSNTECKEFLKSTAGTTTPDSLSCIEYSYDPDNYMLTLKHINAGFNCCPESLFCTVSTSGDTIAIQEFEKSALCNCNCLFDLEIEIKGVVEGKYNIEMIEPYAQGQAELSFVVDLAKDKSGSYCVIRKGYPWGMGFEAHH